MKGKIPNCYKCIHRSIIIDSAYSECTHPCKHNLEICYQKRGKNGGWFDWPERFDPVWLEACNGFTPWNYDLTETGISKEEIQYD